MEKNQIFEFTAPNGALVTGIVVYVIYDWDFDGYLIGHNYIVYAQNRLVFYRENVEKTIWELGEVLVDYCVIPELDTLLEAHYHQLDVADDYADREC